ncbi:hypothetical protein DPMN_119253 [Dreissena polymorpha]|uniref:Uncharacterized protein n=1 Tax=Dreissena polymorpha TaxID=45954 RepID=A0A9D4JR30_DREPO|nr:hypothetical protein DPMN_119253 [Dreissena polymorpha]
MEFKSIYFGHQPDARNERILSYLHIKVVNGVLRRLSENAVVRENAEWTIDQIINSETLSEDIKNVVRQLKQSRTELYSRIVVGVSDEYFAEHVRNLQQAIRQICEFLHDVKLCDEADHQIRNAQQHVGIPGGVDYVHVFNIGQETEETYRERVTGFTPGLNNQ